VAYSLLDDLAQKMQWRHWRLEPLATDRANPPLAPADRH
jgi:hypothetical protein